MCCENDIGLLSDCINSVLLVNKDIKFDIQFNKEPVKSFADLRNKQLDKIRGKSEWILIIDPDERLKGELNINCISNLLEVKVYQTYLHVPEYVPRLFRNLPYIKFEGKLHETITNNFSYLDIHRTDTAWIEHLEVDIREKVLRNESLLDLRKRPDRFYHINHTYLLGDIEKCVKLCYVFLKEGVDDLFTLRTLHILIPILINQHRDDDAIELYGKYKDNYDLSKYSWVLDEVRLPNTSEV